MGGVSLGAHKGDGPSRYVDVDHLSPDDRAFIKELERIPLGGKAGRRSPGRPAIDLDSRIPKDVYEFVQTLAMIGCSVQEICDFLRIQRTTFYLRVKKDPKLQHSFELGRVMGIVGLRRTQMKVAMRGNPTMLMWMGKQKLKQSERGEIEEVLPEGQMNLENLSRDELELFKELLKKTRDDGG